MLGTSSWSFLMRSLIRVLRTYAKSERGRGDGKLLGLNWNFLSLEVKNINNVKVFIYNIQHLTHPLCNAPRVCGTTSLRPNSARNWILQKPFHLHIYQTTHPSRPLIALLLFLSKSGNRTEQYMNFLLPIKLAQEPKSNYQMKRQQHILKYRI